MANDDYYGRMDEANRQPTADMGRTDDMRRTDEQSSRADYHRLLGIAARDREAFHERLHDAAPERKEAEREERQRAQSLHWQQILDRPSAPPSAAAGRPSTAVMVAGFALAALGIWAAAKFQQRAEIADAAKTPDPAPEG